MFDADANEIGPVAPCDTQHQAGGEHLVNTNPNQGNLEDRNATNALTDIADANANEMARSPLDTKQQARADTSLDIADTRLDIADTHGNLPNKDSNENVQHPVNTKSEEAAEDSIDGDENKENEVSKPRFKLGVYSKREPPKIKVRHSLTELDSFPNYCMSRK